MSRRDTIIIAVLVNAGLLMVLFATAMRSDKKETKEKIEAPLVKTEQSVPEATPPVAAKEESPQPGIDAFLDAPIGESPHLATALDEAGEQLSLGEEVEIPPAGTSQVVPVPEAPSAVAVAPPPSTSSAPTKPKVKSEESVATVTVKKGDALEKIAKNHHTTVAAIMKLNNMTSTNLKIGQVLKVSSKEGAAVAAKSASVSEYYVVKEGDNPWLIASRNNLKVNELLKLNNLDEQKAKRLRPGDKLRIR